METQHVLISLYFEQAASAYTNLYVRLSKRHMIRMHGLLIEWWLWFPCFSETRRCGWHIFCYYSSRIYFIYCLRLVKRRHLYPDSVANVLKKKKTICKEAISHTFTDNYSCISWTLFQMENHDLIKYIIQTTQLNCKWKLLFNWNASNGKLNKQPQSRNHHK